MHPYQNLRMFDWIDTLAPGYDRIAFIQPILDRGYTGNELVKTILKPWNNY
jgi:hypothetical protein